MASRALVLHISDHTHNMTCRVIQSITPSGLWDSGKQKAQAAIFQGLCACTCAIKKPCKGSQQTGRKCHRKHYMTSAEKVKGVYVSDPAALNFVNRVYHNMQADRWLPNTFTNSCEMLPTYYTRPMQLPPAVMRLVVALPHRCEEHLSISLTDTDSRCGKGKEWKIRYGLQWKTPQRKHEQRQGVT